MTTALEKVEQSQLRSDLPELRVGSSIRVNYRITEGNKERIQAFEGVLIGKHCGAANNKATFTVRKVTQGYGVERIFPLHSPRIESIDVIKVGNLNLKVLQKEGKNKSDIESFLLGNKALVGNNLD